MCDSKKSGSVTISPLRFGPRPIHSTYLISRANLVACHQFAFLSRLDALKVAEPGAIFLLNSPYGPDDVWDHLPRRVQEQIIDAAKAARNAGMGGRINTVMQPCFFALSGVLPPRDAVAAIKRAIAKTYGKRGEAVVQRNFAAVDRALESLAEVVVPGQVTSAVAMRAPVPAEAPAFVQNVTARIIAGEGDLLPVSALPADGTYPSGTAQWEKRDIAREIPVWDADLCIQCGKCVLVCPHAVIRSKVYDAALLTEAPASFKSTFARWREFSDLRYTLQVAAEDCTGCRLCVEVCPAKSKSEVRHKAIDMAPQAPIRQQERENWNFFLRLPEVEHAALNPEHVKDVQLLPPLFEFSGACAGCGETPYLKLLSQLFGDRALIANATGCSSIYGGNLPTTPWSVNHEGRGPAWSNSLFEDNAEFGLGMRLALDKQSDYARHLLRHMAAKLGETVVQALLDADQASEAGIDAQRQRVKVLKERLRGLDTAEAGDLLSLADTLVKKRVWIIGGDGWGYDIGYGGLDHVLASGHNVNVLLLDTEVYSNTGGQASKATPRGAVAKFAAQGKSLPKKDLALIAMTYGHIYVARVAMGGSDTQTVKSFLEAEAYDGPALIIAYSHCIAHGYDLAHGLAQQKAAVLSGYWPLCRYDPERLKDGKNPLQLDSKPPSLSLEKYAYNETRYTMLAHSRPQEARRLLELAQDDVRQRWRLYEHWAAMPVADAAEEDHHA